MEAAEIIKLISTADICVEERRLLVVAIEQVCRERDKYLHITQTDLNVQIEEANAALEAAGFEDWETIAEGIERLAKERDAAQADVKRLEAKCQENKLTLLDTVRGLRGILLMLPSTRERNSYIEAIDAAMKESPK